MDDLDLSEPTADEQDVERIVAETLAQLPSPWAERFAEGNIAVMVARRATWRQRQAVRLRPGADLYGLYEGIPLTDRTSNYQFVAPDLVTIFAGPLLRDFPEPAERERQVRRTLLHELAHHFGISDARLVELGAY